MTYGSFILLVVIFGGSLYWLEKRPFHIRALKMLDQKRYPFVMLISIFLIAVLAIIGIVLPMVKFISGAGTIFIASYLVFRYRQAIDRRMKG